MRTFMRRGLGTAMAAVLAGGLAVGCGGDDGDGGGSGSGPVELTVDVFGEPGYDALYKQYERAHPGVRIKQRKVSSLDEYKPRIQQWMATGSGAGDVVMLEEGILPLYMQQRTRFLDLFDYGGRGLEKNVLPWKWQMGVSPDGEQLVGLGTDVGPLAMCYRTDLFKKAGLPTGREEVGRLWPTWEAFLSTGQRFQSKMPETKWLDGPTAVFRATVLQNAGNGPGYSFFDKNDDLAFESNPAVRQAFDTALRFEQNKLTADMSVFTPPWQTALKRNTFATVPCPSWMLGGIEEFSGSYGKGRWDVATIPGGSGYWGGSWLAVPKQTKHAKAAAALATFLTSPEGQVGAFKEANVFPSSPQAAQDPAVAGATSAYFNDAPVGQIFGRLVAGVRPVRLGAKNEDVRAAVENVLTSVGQGKQKPEDAWSKSAGEAKKAAR